MTQRTRTALKYIVSAVLTIVFLYLAFRGTDFTRLYASILGANYWWMLVMFGCLMLSHVFRSWRWRFLLDPIKPNIGFRNLFAGLMVGYMVNNVLPRAGELVRPYTIGKLESIPKSAAFGTIVVERLIDTVSFLILILLIPLVYTGPLLETFPWIENAGMIAGGGTMLFLLAMVTLMLRRDWTDSLLKTLRRIVSAKMMDKVEGIIHSFLDGFLFLTKPRYFATILFSSFMVWFLYIVMVYSAFFAFDLRLDFGAALVVQAISSIGIAIPTPGATGGYHVFTSQTLSRLYNVPDEIALSFATVTHAVGYIGVMMIGLYFFVRDHVNVAEAVKEGEKTDE